MRATAPAAWRGDRVRSLHTLHATRHNGPRPASTSAVALTPPTVSTTSATAAGHRHDRSRSARCVNVMSQPRPAHGSRITDSRATYEST